MKMNAEKEKSMVFTTDDKEAWDDCFHSLPLHLQDVNYSYDYHKMYYANGDGDIRLFFFEQNGEKFYYPFLLRIIKIDGVESNYKDIETVYGYTGPISTTNESSFIAEAEKDFQHYCIKENVVTEFIRFNPLYANENLFRNSKTLAIVPLRDYITVKLDRSIDEILLGYTSQNRNKIRKAEKNGVQIVIDSTAKDFDVFVKIYLDNMEHLGAAKMYFFSSGFFDELKKLAINSGTFMTARVDGKILGATVFLKGETMGHYFLSSANEEGKKLAVSNLMLHHGIVWAKSCGLEQIHLGGGVTAADDDPLLTFKMNFSDKKVKFTIGKRVHNQSVYDSLIEKWEKKFPKQSVKYKSILQRYRFTEEDMI